jgi:hypothetical protein
MPTFDVRGVEMHGARMWSWRWISRAIDESAALGLNTLVLHRNDLLDMLAFPARWFDVERIWAGWPVRYHNIDHNRQYLRAVVNRAGDNGMRLFLQVKELSFHESLLTARPELVKDGAICASDPFWWEFLEAKVDEVMTALPDLGGLIVSPATRESRVSIAANACRCPRCAATTAEDWYAALIGAMHRPLAVRGKPLVVRDFSYTRSNQGAVLRAAGRVSPEIVISLKNTPHDYYPTFPHNPAIGHVGAHPQWVEFDTWGQFFGLGIFPAIVLDDMRERFRHSAANGVRGVVARTDWEVIFDASVFDTLNLANLSGFARLAQDPAIPTPELVAAQLARPIATTLGGGLDEARFDLAAQARARTALQDVLLRTWPVMEKTVYVLRHVFHEDCMFPDTLRKAEMMMLEVHGIADWDPAERGTLDLDEAKLGEIYAEKDAALSGAEAMERDILAATADLPEPGRSQLRDTFALYTWYVRGFKACARACFAVRFHRRRACAATRDAAAAEIDALASYRKALARRLAGTRYAYMAYWMLDVARLDSLLADLRALLA